jgi:hypothetical protein
MLGARQHARAGLVYGPVAERGRDRVRGRGDWEGLLVTDSLGDVESEVVLDSRGSSVGTDA